MPYLREIDANRWYTNFGPLEQRLTGRFASHYGVTSDKVVCLSNATTALSISLAALARPTSRFCLLPSFTFVASAQAVLSAGLTPYFLEIDPVTWRLDPTVARDAIARLGSEVAAVMAVAPFGAPLDIASWDRLTEDTGVPVVVDAAAGFDSLVPGRSPSIVSLHATKPLAAGEGGFVISRDVDLVAEVKARANFGFQGSRSAVRPGGNAKLGEYPTAVALAALDQWAETRAGLARATAAYIEVIDAIPRVQVSPGFGDGWVSSTCNVVFDAPVGETAIAALDHAGIESRLWWNKGCHLEPMFSGAERDALPATEDLVERMVGLPFGCDLRAAQIHRVADVLSSISIT